MSLFYHYYQHDYCPSNLSHTDHCHIPTSLPNVYICLLFYMPTISFICRLVFILDFCHTYFRLIFPMCYLSPCLYIPCVCFFLSSSYTLFLLLLRKLPWLSRQSDRLLTDRSLVRSQAEAPFLLFPSLSLLYIITTKKYASRGSRTHDRAVKSRALYRLS